MEKVIVIRNLDGSCSILDPASSLFNPESKDRQNLRDQGIDFKNEQEVLDWVINKVIPEELERRITDKSNLPDYFFRDAWEDNNEVIGINLQKAKEIKKNQFRKLRKEKFKDLDVAYARADEDGDDMRKEAIRVVKQELRDVTLLELPEDIEQLKSFIPQFLL